VSRPKIASVQDQSVDEDGPTQVHSEEPPFDIAREVNGLRWFIARASSLVRALEGSFERDSWEGSLGEDRRRMEELSHLVGAAVEALLAATNAGDKLAARLAKSTNDRLAVALARHPVGA
jgi:hypothetical protein